MKININEVRIVPKKVCTDFKLCVYGKVSDRVNDWINYHNLKTEHFGNIYTNIIVDSLDNLFEESKVFKYLDGFSPNLNKELHIGHLSNLILAKAFYNLGIVEETVSIYGDIGSKEQNEMGFTSLRNYQAMFDYKPSKEFFATQIPNYNNTVTEKVNSMLIEGKDEYTGCKVFDFKLVGIKSDGSTTYFYQDVLLASILNDKTLYLTGNEQVNHFNQLKQLFPDITHIGLGLVQIEGSKMSSREGNVILISDLLNIGSTMFEEYSNELMYNVFAGYILKSNISSNKSIRATELNEPNKSLGLYISYTTARLISAGCEIKEITKFNSLHLEMAYLLSKENLKPNILFVELVEHCKIINQLYLQKRIQGNKVNKVMFEQLLSDLTLGLKYLGMYCITKI